VGEAVRDPYRYFTQTEVENLLQSGYNAALHALEEGREPLVKSFPNRARSLPSKRGKDRQ
jgi:hypothetical protein